MLQYRFMCSIIPWVHCRDWRWGRYGSARAWPFFTSWLKCGWFSDGSKCTIFLLLFLLRVGFVTVCWSAGNYPMCWGIISLVVLFGLWCRTTQQMQNNLQLLSISKHVVCIVTIGSFTFIFRAAANTCDLAWNTRLHLLLWSFHYDSL